MLKAHFRKYQLKFKFNAITSRGEMPFKNGYYLFLNDGTNTGIGECSFIEGLSRDDLQNYEWTLEQWCARIENGNEFLPDLNDYPSIKFASETSMLDLKSHGSKILFPSDFTKGTGRLPINGLVWMGSREFMEQQIRQKLAEGYRCIKIKVGAINFDDEIGLLEFIRQKFPAELVELRLDANGAFNGKDVFEKLKILSGFNIHSIEQPVKQGQLELMKKVCAESPIPVTLDEELIDLKGMKKKDLLQFISPHYIILKPSLLGGFAECNEWIKLADEMSIQWWATSALESNIGLNAIAQWVYTKSHNIVQGLGTGGLYTENISSPLFINQGYLGYDTAKPWGDV